MIPSPALDLIVNVGDKHARGRLSLTGARVASGSSASSSRIIQGDPGFVRLRACVPNLTGARAFDDFDLSLALVRIALGLPGAAPYCLGELDTPFPVAAAVITSSQGATVDLPATRRLTLDPPPYDGAILLTVDALAPIELPYNFTADQLRALLPAETYKVAKKSENAWEISGLEPAQNVTLSADVSGLLVPLGLAGQMALNTVALAAAFTAAGNPKWLPLTLEIDAHFPGENLPRKIFQDDRYEVARALLDLNALVPTPIPASDFATLSAAIAGKQPINAGLTALAALATTAWGRALLAKADGPELLAYISGQPLSAQLTALAALVGKNYGRQLLTKSTSADARLHLALDQVDNTSDADKPISTATQTELDAKAVAADLDQVDNTADLDKPLSTPQAAAFDYIDVSRAPYNVDMTGEDDGTAGFLAAVAAATALRKSVYIPHGWIKITDTIEITAPVGFTGPGILKWAGPAGGLMMRLYHFIQDEMLPFQLTLDCANLAASGLEFDGVQRGKYNLKVYDFTTGYGVIETGSDGFTSSYKKVWLESLYQQASTAVGGACLYTGGTHAGNSCHNTFFSPKLVYTGSKDGLHLGPCDNNTFIDLFEYRPPNVPGQPVIHTGAGVRIVVDPVNAAGLPVGNHFYHPQCGAGGWVQADCPNPGTVIGYQQDNGQPDPVLNGTELTILNGAGDFSGLNTINVRQGGTFGGDIRGGSNILARNPTAASRVSNGAFAHDYESSFAAAYLTKAGPDTLGEAIPGVPWANLAALVFDEMARVLIFTSNNTPIDIAPARQVRARFHPDGRLELLGYLEAAGDLATEGNLIAAGTVQPADGYLAPTSAGTARFALDSAAGAPLTILNGATATPFGNAGTFSGLFIINDPNASGSTGVFICGGGGLVTMLGQSGAGPNFATVKDTAARSNVYINGAGSVEIQNLTGSTVNYKVTATRMRTSL